MKKVLFRKIYVMSVACFFIFSGLNAAALLSSTKSTNHFVNDLREHPTSNNETIWYVDDVEGTVGEGNPPEDFTSIQAAINAANVSGNDTIYVYKGTYQEIISIDKSLKLLGECREETNITGLSTENNIEITKNVDQVKIYNFTIHRNATNGINIRDGESNGFYITIENCTIREYEEIGIKVGRDEVNIINCTIANNTKGNDEFESCGISLFKTGVQSLSNIAIESSIIDNNGPMGIEYRNGYGIHSNNFKIQSCNISNHTKHAIRLYNVDGIKIGYCCIKNNNESIMMEQSKGCYLYNCTINKGKSGITLEDSSLENIIQGCNISYMNKTALIISTKSDNNTIFECNITNNGGYGVEIKDGFLYDPKENKLYHNNFIKNHIGHASDYGINIWDNKSGFENNIPEEYGGNFWDDYPGGDSDGDGIGDKKYNISGRKFPQNSDNFPLINRYSNFPKRNDKPCVSIKFPLQGVYLKNTITIEWNATDDSDNEIDNCSSDNLTINISLIWENGSKDIIGTKIKNTGTFSWNTTNVTDGLYKINISAFDGNKTGCNECNGNFIIYNDNRPYLSHLIIRNREDTYTDYVKNNDVVIITVDVLGVGVSNDTIHANLSLLGGNNSVIPDIYTGISAIWYVKDVTCENDGIIEITVSAMDNISKKRNSIVGCIIADNTPPSIEILSPKPGFYLFDRFIIGFPQNFVKLSIAIGKITLRVDPTDNGSMVKKIEWWENNEQFNSSNIAVLDWKLRNLEKDNFYPRKITVKVFDHVGNMNLKVLYLLKIF